MSNVPSGSVVAMHPHVISSYDGGGPSSNLVSDIASSEIPGTRSWLRMLEPANTADRCPTISPNRLDGVTCHNNGVKFLNDTGSWRRPAACGGAEADHCWCGGIIVQLG